MKVSSTILAASLVLLSHLAVADAHADSGRAERLQAKIQQRFTRADLNSDGRLSAEEAQAGMPFVARHFAVIDEEGQGSVSLEQVKAFARTQMAGRRSAQ